MPGIVGLQTVFLVTPSFLFNSVKNNESKYLTLLFSGSALVYHGLFYDRGIVKFIIAPDVNHVYLLWPSDFVGIQRTQFQMIWGAVG